MPGPGGGVPGAPMYYGQPPPGMVGPPQPQPGFGFQPVMPPGPGRPMGPNPNMQYVMPAPQRQAGGLYRTSTRPMWNRRTFPRVFTSMHPHSKSFSDLVRMHFSMTLLPGRARAAGPRRARCAAGRRPGPGPSEHALPAGHGAEPAYAPAPHGRCAPRRAHAAVRR